MNDATTSTTTAADGDNAAAAAAAAAVTSQTRVLFLCSDRDAYLNEEQQTANQHS